MINPRLINKNFIELKEVQSSFIDECQDLDISKLEDATKTIESIIPDIMKYVSRAKQNCNRDSTYLTLDESAAIYLYTMPSAAVFSPLNKALRNVNRNARKPWLAYLKLLKKALQKLPTTEKIKVWRGINSDCALDFPVNDVTALLGITSCSTNPKVVENFLDNGGTLLEIDNCCGKNIAAYSSTEYEEEVILMPGTRVRRLKDTLDLNGYFILYLEEINTGSNVSTIASNSLCQKIKQEYLQNNRIELIMNPSKSFPIDKIYINLTVVETKEQQEIEKKLMNKKVNTEMMSIFEEIHRVKNAIKVKDIFVRFKQKIAKIVVVGRAGIGKTTFCRYAAHQWAMGTIWERYGLVVLIRLRSLTSDRYHSNRNYMPVDLIEKEYFACDPLSEEVRAEFKGQCDAGEVLWLLDGYDEFVQNIPKQLADVFNYIRTKQHHILTSRPFMMNLAYDVQLEITGFTDGNTREYVHQFFNQIEDRSNDAQIKMHQLKTILESNSRIWGIAHVPVMVELICCIWCDIDWSETMDVTVTSVYDKMTEWICRRYLEKQNTDTSQMAKEGVYCTCKKELMFLESLAFHGMQTNDIIIHPQLLSKAMKEAGHCSQDRSCLLNMGILKSLEYKAIGTRIETDKCHYFVHLSFQEYFAARYLLRALSGTEDSQKKATDFIRAHKYNQRFELVLNFTCAFLLDVDDDDKKVTKLLWSVLLGEPLDLIGYKHAQLLISCLEETEYDRRNPFFDESIKLIKKWIIYYAHQNYEHPLARMLRRSPSLVSQNELLDTFTQLVKSPNPVVKERAFRLLSDLPILHPSSDLINLQIEGLSDNNNQVKVYAYVFLGNLRGELVNEAIINKLICMFTDKNAINRSEMSRNVSHALLNINNKALMDMTIDAMILAMGSDEIDIPLNACKMFDSCIRWTGMDEIVVKLTDALHDADDRRRRVASYILSQMTIETVSDQLLHEILSAMNDPDDFIRINVYRTLQGLAKKIPNVKVMKALICALEDPVDDVRRIAYSTMGDFGEEAAIGEVISRLVTAVEEDRSPFVRSAACQALGKLSENLITNEVISCLAKTLEDKSDMVICSACQSIGKMGERMATTEILEKLTIALRHKKSTVRYSASETLGKIGMNAKTDEILRELVIAYLDDGNFVYSSAWRTLEQLYGETSITVIVHKITELLENPNYLTSKTAIKLADEMVRLTSFNQVFPILCKLLEHTDKAVRRSICRILGEFVNGGVKNEVIKYLTIMLQDLDDGVKICAINSLAKISEETSNAEISDALTKILKDLSYEVIDDIVELRPSLVKRFITVEALAELINMLKSSSDDIRKMAMNALSSVDKQLITPEMVAELSSLFKHPWYDVREDAFKLILSLGKQWITAEVLHEFLNMLRDPRYDIGKNAMKFIMSIDKRLITTEIADILIDMFKSPSKNVRKIAIDALLSLDKQLITPEMVAKLIDMHKDPCNYIKQNAIKALMFLNDQFITAEMCSQALESVEDVYEVVEWHKLYTINQSLAETIMTKSITVLNNALKSVLVQDRFDACEAIRRLNTDALSMALIDTIVGLLQDNDENVRESACKILISLGMKAAKDEVINALLHVYHTERFVKPEVYEAIENILPLIPSMAQLKSEMVLKLSRYMSECFTRPGPVLLRRYSVEKLIKTYFETEIEFWLPIIEKTCISRQCCLIIDGNHITVINNEDLLDVIIPNAEVRRQMLTYFVDNKFNNYPDGQPNER